MKLDLTNPFHQMIVGAMANLVDEGHSPREVFELLDDIKRNTFHGLAEMAQERKNANSLN